MAVPAVGLIPISAASSLCCSRPSIKYKSGIREFTCMSVRWIIKTGIILIFLLVLSPSVAAIGESIIPSLLIGIDIAQEKNLVTVSVDDAITTADKYAEQGDYERAVNIYSLAEKKYRDDNVKKGHDSKYYYRLSSIEHKKSRAYGEWGGHDEEAGITHNNAMHLEDVGDEERKQEGVLSDCLIVTATYGSPLSSEVQLVRDYRDGTIRESYTGSQFFTGFNAWYYSFSPAVSGYIATHPLVKSGMQISLVPLLGIVLLSQNLHAALGFSPELATISVLLFGAAFYSLVYILPPAFLAVWLAKKKGWNVPAPKRMKPFLDLWILLLAGLALGIFISLDLLTIATSGLLVGCTIVLVAGSCSLTLMQYLKSGSGTGQV